MKGVVVLSRLPFLLPGLAALTSGIGIAAIEGRDVNAGFAGLSVLGLALIMLGTYYFNEYYDYAGDVINKKFTQFSGGSRALPDGMVPRNLAKVAGYGTIATLVVIAVVYMVFYFEDYPLLLPLGLFGAFCGIFYSSPPFQWAYHGIGEIMIGGCYGVLPFVSGFYVASGELDYRMALVGVPAALTIFAVIVGNEFPDYDADKTVNKRNLIVRLGLPRGSRVYLAAMALTYPFMLLTILTGVSPLIALTGIPVLILCAAAIKFTVKGGYADRQAQIKISGLTLIANLASCFMFPLAFYLQGL